MRRLIDLLNCYHLIIQRLKGPEEELVTARKTCGQVQWVLQLVMMWKKCFIDGCCLADKYRDSGQKYKVEEI